MHVVQGRTVVHPDVRDVVAQRQRAAEQLQRHADVPLLAHDDADEVDRFRVLRVFVEDVRQQRPRRRELAWRSIKQSLLVKST